MDERASPAMLDKIAGAFGFPGQEPVDTVIEDNVIVGDGEGDQLADGGDGDQVVVDDAFDDLEWEGQTLKVPKGLKEAVMRTDDYTKKTQEIAEQRRAIEQVQSLNEAQRLESAFAQSISAEQQEIGIIDAYLKQVSSLDWSQMSGDDLFRKKIELDQIKERRTALADSINGKRSKFTEEMQAKFNELRGKAREIASKSINGFSEETEKTIREHAKSSGLTDREIDNVLLDPRSTKLIWEAAQYAKAKSGTAQAVDKAAKVIKPGVAGNRMTPDIAAKLNFRKAIGKATTSGQKAQVIEQRLAGLFGKGK